MSEELDKVDQYFHDSKISKPSEYIVASACIVQNTNTNQEIIIVGARHWDKLMRTQFKQMINVKIVHHKQGFVNQFGQYRTRKEALKIVQLNGQRFDAERNSSKTELFSEGVW
jgi:hypothetical protein